MVKMIFISAILVAVVPYCHGELISLQLDSLKKINTEALNNILLFLLTETEKITTEQKAKALECDVQINETISSCKRCATDICQPGQSPIPDDDVFVGLLRVANKPLLMAVDLLKGFVNRIGVDKSLTEKILRKLRFITRTLENALESAGSKLFEMPISHVRRVGEKVVNELVNTVVETGKFVGNIGYKVIDFAIQTVKSEVEKNGHKIVNTAQKLGHLSKDLVGPKTLAKLERAKQGIEKAGRGVGEFFTDLFGKLARGLTDKESQDIVSGAADMAIQKTPDIVNSVAVLLGRGTQNNVNDLSNTIGKTTYSSSISLTSKSKEKDTLINGGLSTHSLKKRCVKRCPDCEQLDINKKSEEQIVRSVCGRSFVKDQQNAVDRLTKMGNVYNYLSSKKPIVTKVEYEPSSVINFGGDVALKRCFVTFQLSQNTTRKFRLRGPFTITNLDAATNQIADQITKQIFK